MPTNRIAQPNWMPPLVLAATLVATLVAGCGFTADDRPSVWVDNRSSVPATFFVTDNSLDHPAGWFVVPARTSAHAGSAGLGSPDVRVNALGWNHEANHVGKCAPGDYDDTLHDVPRSSSVRLLIDEMGMPSVSLVPEPAGLVGLVPAPLGDLPEDQRC
jgi:hypothetical protein